MAFLPYHCPITGTDHLLEPCKKNLARAKALKEAHKHVGPMERCEECGGKLLETKPRTVIEGLPAPESWPEKEFVVGPPQDPFKPYRQDWPPNQKLTTAPLFLKDVGKKEVEMRKLSLEQIAKGREAVKRLTESHKLGKKPPKSEETVPELPKKTGFMDEVPRLSAGKEILYQDICRRAKSQQKEPVPAVELTEVIEEIMHPFYPELNPGLRYCPTHPEVLQRKDKLGRWMGMCDECLSARGKKCGKQNFERGVTAPPMSIPLNLPKYAELKAWLEAEALEHEQTLTGAIMYVLKMAWRQGV